jgi:RNA exonuclease 1
MAKRKRSDNDREPADVGLGATLAHLRGEDATNGAPSTAANDDEGWTVVGSKRRRKEHGSNHHHYNHNNNRRKSSHSHRPDRSRSRSTEALNHQRGDDSEDSSRSPSHVAPAENPFAPKDAAEGHLPAPRNPFSTDRNGSGDTSLTKEERRKERKLDRHYPAIEHSHHARLQSHVKITDLQALVLYLLADGNAPQWVSVRNRNSIQRVVMLMVPGLDLGMFNGKIALDAATLSEDWSDGETMNILPDAAASAEGSAEPKRLRISPDDFYPATLRSSRLPAAMVPLADIFDHVWPIKTPGEHRAGQYIKLHSPIHTMLTSQIPKTQEEKHMKKKGNHKGPMPQNSKHWDNKRTRITEYVASLVDQQENEYVPHPAMFTTPESKEAALQRRTEAKQGAADGWVDTHVTSLADGEVPEEDIEQGSVTAGRHIISVDCEMCKAENDEFVLTRVSLIDWQGNVVMDKLVKPDLAIKDYLTQYSGITAAMLEDVTTTLSDIQKELLELVTPRTILVGHSLNSDLNALKLTHPFLIDTGILYPHPRGPPYKQSLRWLAQKYLHREVQKGSKGHDSVEDSLTALDLVKQKCEKGPAWGTGDTNAESIFKRFGRSTRPKTNDEKRTGAVIDWGEPNRGHGSQASISIGCKSDDEVVKAIDDVLKGNAAGKEGTTINVDFIWARLRELELSRGWWDDAKTADVETIRQNALQRIGLAREDTDVDIEVKGSELGNAVSRTVKHIEQIYESLPRCTAFIVYSGTGDPREIRRLQAMQQQYRREYQTKNWDNLSVKWTDTEMQALSKACQDARNGVGFIAVK